MNAKLPLAILTTAALAGAGGWFAASHFRGAHDHAPAAKTDSSAKKVLYYQSAMHPWVKADKPGKCTVCGMDLVPVYEGQKGYELAAGTVSLGTNAIQAVHVQTASVSKRPLVRTLRVAGTIDDNDAKHRRLTAYVEGRIEKLHVNYVGAEVKEGEPLATFYSPMLLNAEREYALLFRQSQAAHTYALTAEHKRLLAAAEQRLTRYGLTSAQIAKLPFKAETNHLSEILAPMSGTVVTRDVYEGQFVKEGDKLFELADFFTMWFQFDLYERDFAWVRVGQEVEITVPSAPGKKFVAAIAFIDPNLNDMTRSARVRVELQNPLITVQGKSRRELLHRTYAEALVKLDTPEVLALPRSAVLHTGDRAVVYVDKGGGAYEQRRVKLGRAGEEHWEILDGVKEGENIVTTGNLLIDGQAQLNSQAGESSPAAPVAVAAPKANEPLPSGVKPYPLDVCIVTGLKLGSMGDPPSLIHQGQQFKFCCGACTPKFNEEPAKFLQKLSALTKSAAPQTQNTQKQ
ncbi:MAG: efflux RND transporter periplasmic adaptor subunit [Verrucomicrobia bacterium]|nr:efflux RND transporter periplasmic adaptor subunit [Verrucomicrobiota bacterium]